MIEKASSSREDILGSLLQVFQRELTETLRPDLTSSYALHVCDVLSGMLDHMQEWVTNTDNPETTAARRALLSQLKITSFGEAVSLPDFEDNEALDEPLANAIADLVEADTKNPKSIIAHAVAATDETMHALAQERQRETRESRAAFLSEIDVELSAERVNRYLSSELGLSRDATTSIRKIPGGYSKDTFLVELESGRGLIVRRDFPFGPVNSSAPDEFGLLDALHKRGFPVAKPLRAEYDKRFFGQPFLLVARVPGIDADHAAKADPDVAKHVSLELARLLGELHRITPSQLGFDQIADNPKDLVRDYLHDWRRWWDLHRVHPSSLGEAAYAWLDSNIPDAIERTVVIHGDARPGNMLYHDGKVTGLLDWEFAHPGDAAEDLLYARGFIEPYVAWTEFMETYLGAGGVAISEEREQYYGIFRSWRNVVCTDVAWGGFVRGKYPAFKLAAQGVLYKRVIAAELATSLKQVTG